VRRSCPNVPALDFCEHLLAIAGDEPGPKPAGGCGQCLELGDTWVHLRFCLDCGQVGCCDESKNRHASKHAAERGHHVARSKEPGEMWAWCYPDDQGIDLVGEETWA
jgi:uncharacterized UBP type Zn finger protein